MDTYDVIVVGAGHAGIEAALASARMGCRTLCITLNLERIGHLPCNCSIGGPAKGHIAREVDALGGEMGVATDCTLTHIRKVGTGKGPAVQTARAHVCKELYPEYMQDVMRNQENLTLLEGMVHEIVSDKEIEGVKYSKKGDDSRNFIACKSVIITTGTFLNGLCHMGDERKVAARDGDDAVITLTDSLKSIGIEIKRFKTGTTPRLAKSTIDFNQVLAMESDETAGPFSFIHDRTFEKNPLLPCWQTHTNEDTHQVLKENLAKSAMYSGRIEGVGPRYCPSIEDKVVNFADKNSHPVFLEQEEWDSESMYIQGFSTSMPADVQLAAIRTIKGLEKAEIMKPGYAVEYDVANPMQLNLTLMSKMMPGLFLAGQINGTSGYEEAAGQGIIAGINAVRYVRGDSPFILTRDKAFLGVMIDDLITKGVDDPYRMLTARAEYRIILRHDNADMRLTPLGREVGLVCDKRWNRYCGKMEKLNSALDALNNHFVGPQHTEVVEGVGTGKVVNKTSLFDLIKRPEITIENVENIIGMLGYSIELPKDKSVREQIKIAAIYDGYLQRQQDEVDRIAGLEKKLIPDGIVYAELRGLSYESVEKFSKVKPQTLGQASRIPGVRPSDIVLLSRYI